MSGAGSKGRSRKAPREQRRPVRWSPSTLAVLCAVRRWLANEGNALRRVLDGYVEREASGAPGAQRAREDLEELYEYVRAQQQTFDELVAPQNDEPPAADAMEMLSLNFLLDKVWRERFAERRGMYRLELAAATLSPGAAAGEPATRGQEGESRQACEPAGPARGSRRAKAAVSGERGQAPRSRGRAR